MEVVAVVVAAGESCRMGAAGDKQSALISGAPVLARAVRAFEDCADVDRIVVVCSAERVDAVRTLVGECRLSKAADVVVGGAARQQSVANGVSAVAGDAIVAVHDGARPLVTPELISATIAALPGWDGVVPGLAVTDTVKQVDAEGRVTATLDRAATWLVQTPQVFRSRVLREALAAAARDGIEATDDAALVERVGGRVRVIEGLADNIKITVPGDLTRAEEILEGRGRSGDEE